MVGTKVWTEEFVEVGGTETQVLRGGSGPPLVVLHGARGNPGWMPYHEALISAFYVVCPVSPGLR